MKYPMIAVIVVVLLATAGFYFYTQNQSVSDSMMKKDEAKMQQSEATTQETDVMVDKSAGSDSAIKKPEDAMMEESGIYTPYSDSAFKAASGKKRVLFFFANWCPTCKPIDTELSTNTSQIPSDLAIFRVNYNDSDTDANDKALARQYGITYQHTFVQVDDQGNEIAKWNGGGLDKIVSSLK